MPRLMPRLMPSPTGDLTAKPAAPTQETSYRNATDPEDPPKASEQTPGDLAAATYGPYARDVLPQCNGSRGPAQSLGANARRPCYGNLRILALVPILIPSPMPSPMPSLMPSLMPSFMPSLMPRLMPRPTGDLTAKPAAPTQETSYRNATDPEDPPKASEQTPGDLAAKPAAPTQETSYRNATDPEDPPKASEQTP